MSDWVEIPEGSDFTLANLPFGVVRPVAEPARVAVRVGDHAVDLRAAGIVPELTGVPTLNALAASGRGGEVRRRVGELLAGSPRPDVMIALDDTVEVLLPIAVGDYVDFYSSLHHATNLGRIMRPDAEPLLPNWRQLPVGYHGRSSTVVVSGTDFARPRGLIAAGPGGPGEYRPTALLDFELEVGCIVGGPPARHISPDAADSHVFGFVLLNDWSARDIQGFEYQPLGPNLAKSFATSISPWVVTLDALTPFLVDAPPQDPPPATYLQAERPWAIDLNLTVELNRTEITRTNFAGMYWTYAQQLAHTTANGATTAAGDLFGSGTVSGPQRHERGSMIELTWRGTEPLVLADGTSRSFLHDGDTVTMRGWCGEGDRRVGFGDVRGTVLPAVDDKEQTR